MLRDAASRLLSMRKALKGKHKPYPEERPRARLEGCATSHEIMKRVLALSHVAAGKGRKQRDILDKDA